MKTVCDHYNVKYIELKDIEKQWGHPSQKGMQAIAEQVAAAIN
jgi:lysophospholipase L1-like esterase